VVRAVIILALVVMFAGCRDYRESKVLYENEKCVIIQVNDSTLVIGPGINSSKGMDAKVVFINRKKE
jgi:protein associated with RNAse G/E